MTESPELYTGLYTDISNFPQKSELGGGYLTKKKGKIKYRFLSINRYHVTYYKHILTDIDTLY